MKIKTAFIIFAILVQPSNLRAKYFGGKEVEKISGTNLAQKNEPVRAPFFRGEGLPTPPQQNAPWPHGADALSIAAATLFEQGLADPRGLEYREIEIAVGSPWNGGGYPLKTHGWILPNDGKDGRFAVAWNGLVYPVMSLGHSANLHNDWEAISKGKDRNSMIIRRSVAEEYAVHFGVLEPLKVVLLLRLGETELARRLWELAPHDEKDPYLDLANDWTWNAFERAATAHMRGDDRLALADARMLAKIQPLIEVEAEQRGFIPDTDYSNSPSSMQLWSLLADCERRVANQKNPSLPKNDIAALIDDLENVDARQSGQPGGVNLAEDPRVKALVKRGAEAVEPLLDAMENDTRLTRSVSFGRSFFRSRHLISVSEAAYAALVDFLRVDFRNYGEDGKPLSRKELAAHIRAYWAKMRDLSPAERFYAMLRDDKAGKDQWLQAGANIVQPTDVESHGGWTTIPKRKPGQKVILRGESLRDGRTPSVSQLLAQRSDDIAAIRTNSTAEHFLYLDAGRMALYLADWDKTAAISTLKKRLSRAWSIGAQPNDILAFNGNPVEHFGTMIAKMTLARARCGDETAYDEYAAWIQRVELKGVSFGGKELQSPLIEGAAHPSIEQAIDYLFNDPKSPWSNALAEGNGFWLLDFWQTPLSNTAGFRKQALRALTDESLAGAITFHPRKDWNSHTEAQIELKGLGLGFRGSNDDPDTPPPGQKVSFRVCDAFAYFYSQYQNGPKFQLFWPEEKRDAGVLACRKWLEEK
ncbi:MAG TPA: hypothetical protein VJZ77_19055 [Blastocatellia bacterium]|nr:hypothetical protein [Blastocatellia bacterium]